MYQVIRFFCLFIFILLMETTVVPSISGSLRIDFFLAAIIGFVLYVPFSYGIFFVFVASFLLQAHSGILTGILPFVYILVYLGVWLVKDFVYLENSRSQFIIACLFNLLIIVSTGLMMNRWFMAEGIRQVILNAAITGLCAPPLIFCINYLWPANEK